MTDKLNALVDAVAAQGDAAASAQGQLVALLAAVAALVRTHPDPQAFAQEMRRCWLQLGEPHTRFAASAPALAGIDEVLQTLEQCCSVRLNLRPPGAAADPVR